MEATVKNEKIARSIINLLAENECTVNEAQDILRFVSMKISMLSTVQKTEKPLLDQTN